MFRKIILNNKSVMFNIYKDCFVPRNDALFFPVIAREERTKQSIIRYLINNANKFIIIFSLLLLPCFVKAQFTDIYNYYSLHELRSDSINTEIGVSYNTFAASNSIKNEFVNALLSKKYLSNVLKKNNPVTSINYFGSEDNACFYFARLPDSLFGVSNIGYRISVENNFHGDARFSNDLYNLTFFGNKLYAGKSADFSNTQITFIRYQQVKFGLFKQSVRDGDPFTIYFGMGLIKGQTINSVTLDTANLFTDETGSSLDLNMQALYFSSDTGKKKIYDFNGFGACADLAFVYEDKKSDFLINCSLNDIGFMWWNKNSLIVPIDTFIHWDGVQLDSLLWGDDTTYNAGISKDSIMNIIYSKSKKTNFVKVIPEKINISFTKRFLEKSLHITLGFSYLYHANCPLPLVYTRGDYFFRNKMSVSTQFAYGGYDKFQLGIGVSAMFTKHFKLQITAGNVLGFIVPDKTFAQSASGRLVYIF